MTRRRVATLLTLLLLAGAFAIVALRRNTSASSAPAAPPAGATPQDAVYAMLEAARAGDVPAYLDSLTGPQAEAAAQTLRETGPERFSASLKQSQASIKGIAVLEPRELNLRQCRLKAEYVFADRNETQAILLTRRNGNWKVESIAPAQRVPTSVPYGTPVQ